MMVKLVSAEFFSEENNHAGVIEKDLFDFTKHR